MKERYTFKELCRQLGKTTIAIRNIQNSLGLDIPKKGNHYSHAYLIFLQKVVSLRTYNVSLEEIKRLFVCEKKIMQHLNADSLTGSPTWYLDYCGARGQFKHRLLLTGYDLGPQMTGNAIQSNLDFSEKLAELFDGKEMGEDIRKMLAQYLKKLDKIKAKLRAEQPVLRQALAWGRQVLA